MRVPADATNPTFDDTTRVGFWAWLTSTGRQRAEWARRRNAAARAAKANQNARVDDWRDAKQAEREQRNP